MNRAPSRRSPRSTPTRSLVKGDLTCDGLDEEYAAFLAIYGTAFGDRLHHVRGNHDAYRHQTYAPEGPAADRRRRAHDRPARHHDRRPDHRADAAEQLEWLEDLAAEADRPVLAPRPPPRVEPRCQRPARRLLRHPPRRLRAVHRRRRPPPADPRLLRRPHPPQPGAAVPGHRRPAVGRGGLREGLPGHVGRVPGVRGRGAPGPPAHLHPRGAGLDREDPRHVRRRLRATYAFGELGDRCFAMPAADEPRPPGAARRRPGARPRHRGRRPGCGPLPRRLRRRRPQGRAARRAATAPAAWACPTRRRHVAVLEARSAATSAARRSTSSPTTARHAAAAGRGRARRSSRTSGPARSSGSASAPTCCSPQPRRSSIPRVTGFGQDGPYAAGRASPPSPRRCRASRRSTASPTAVRCCRPSPSPTRSPRSPPPSPRWWRSGRGRAGGRRQPARVALPVHGPAAGAYATTGYLQPRLGSGIPYSVPRGTWHCADGHWVAVSTSAESVAARVMELIGLGDRADLADFNGRIAARDEIDARMAEFCAARTLRRGAGALRGGPRRRRPVYDMADIASPTRTTRARGSHRRGRRRRRCRGSSPASAGRPGRSAGPGGALGADDPATWDG